MATIKLTRVKCKNLTTKEDMWRLGVKSIGNVSAEDFVKHAAEHCDVKVGTLRAALAAFVDSAKLFLSMGHGVQLGDLGTLQLSVTSKATKLEKDLTAKNLTGVNVNLRPIGDLAKEIKNFKFSVVGAVNEEDDDNTGTIDPGTSGSGSNNNVPFTPSGNQSSVEDVTYTFKYHDDTEDTRSGQPGEAVNAPAADSGYHWPSDLPTVFGNVNKTFTEVKDAASATPTETPTDPTKVLLLFNDGAHGNVIVKRMEVEPGYQLQASDLPDGYIYAFKSDDQADIDAASAGEAVWVTLSPRS